MPKILTSKLYIFLILITTSGIFSCSKEKEYPIIPVIEYKSFLYDYSSQKGNMVIGFTDGDGDIGLYSNQIYPPFDTTSIYHYNFYINIQEKINGSFIPLVIFNQITQQNDTVTFKYRIPYIEPVSANGSLKGEFSTKLDIDLMLPYLNSDTIRFETYIYDRKLNKSNTIVSSEIIF
jgi:hypothetical protein